LAKKYHILVWFWLFALLTSTVGVSVHAIYCYCTQKTSFTLFEQNNKCQKSINKPDCCQKLPKSCCEKNTKDPIKKKCTKKTTKVFQLKTEFTFDTFQLQDFEYQAITNILPVFEYCKSQPIVALALAYFNKAPPPLPESGQFIRYFICSLRC
jgi:hypothetical protein